MQIQTPAPFELLVTLGWIGLFMFIGVILRAKIPLFRKYLIPSCIIGGVIAMILNLTGLLPTGLLGVDQSMISALAFHLFGLFYAAVALTVVTSTDSKLSNKSFTMRLMIGGMWIIAIQQTVSIVMGPILGYTMLGSNAAFGTDYIGSTATLLITGFVAGPGPAMATGLVWDKALGGGHNLASLGLTCGSLGFLFAYLIGIPLANYYHHKKACTQNVECLADDCEQRGYYNVDEADMAPSIGKETTFAGNIDSFAFQFGIIFVIYLLATAVAYACVSLLGDSPTAGVIWSLFFTFPIITGFAMKALLQKMGYIHLINQQVNNRVKGALIDFIVMSSFFSIVVQNISQYFIFLVIAVPLLCAVIIGVSVLAGRAANNFKEERTLFFVGLMTGTSATGLFLTRIIDPDGKNPLPSEVAFTPMFALLFSLPFAAFGHWEILYKNSFSEWAMIQAGIAIFFVILAIVSTKLLNRAYSK